MTSDYIIQTLRKLPKGAQETFFKERGVNVPSNAKKRREAYIELLREEQNE